MDKRITIVGAGYVGFSLAVLLSQKNDVKVFDIDENKVNLINKRKSFILEEDFDQMLLNKDLALEATLDQNKAYVNRDFIVIAVPTDYDSNTNFFDTSLVEKAVESILKINSGACIIIKSTVPVGFTLSLQNKFNTKNIFFSPEFLREGSAINDNLFPSRIIIGSECNKAREFAEVLLSISKNKNTNVMFTESSEAEAIKLFANTYLAMRVSFFNELDSYAISKKLNSESIIKGVCHDPRIGNHYNNPSFGYGGYCLPKDTKQLLANYIDIPQNLIEAIVRSNSTRKDFIANEILSKNPKLVGIYRINMKFQSDNFRTSSIKGIINRLRKKGIKLIIYEPLIKDQSFYKSEVINNLDIFLSRSDIIIANRVTNDLSDYMEKVYTRDIFNKN